MPWFLHRRRNAPRQDAPEKCLDKRQSLKPGKHDDIPRVDHFLERSRRTDRELAKLATGHARFELAAAIEEGKSGFALGVVGRVQHEVPDVLESARFRLSIHRGNLQTHWHVTHAGATVR